MKFRFHLNVLINETQGCCPKEQTLRYGLYPTYDACDMCQCSQVRVEKKDLFLVHYKFPELNIGISPKCMSFTQVTCSNRGMPDIYR